MVQFYIRKIKDNTITLDEVPALWRKQVAELLYETTIKEERK